MIDLEVYWNVLDFVTCLEGTMCIVVFVLGGAIAELSIISEKLYILNNVSNHL